MSAFDAWQQVIRACQPLDATTKVNVLLASAFMLGIEEDLAAAVQVEHPVAVLARQAAADLVADEGDGD